MKITLSAPWTFLTSNSNIGSCFLILLVNSRKVGGIPGIDILHLIWIKIKIGRLLDCGTAVVPSVPPIPCFQNCSSYQSQIDLGAHQGLDPMGSTHVPTWAGTQMVRQGREGNHIGRHRKSLDHQCSASHAAAENSKAKDK